MTKKSTKKETKEIIAKSAVKILTTKNITSILQLMNKGISYLLFTFLRPFWFSSSDCRRGVVVPYIYTMFNMICFYISVYLFLSLSYKAATIGIKVPHIILPTIAGVIGTLIALNHSMLTIYNKGKQPKSNNKHSVTVPPVVTNNVIPPSNTPPGVVG